MKAKVEWQCEELKNIAGLVASWLASWILKFQVFKESGKKQPKIPASYEFLPAMTHTPVTVVSLCSLVDGCKRKNADQNNSEYGHFLRSVRLENITEKSQENNWAKFCFW